MKIVRTLSKNVTSVFKLRQLPSSSFVCCSFLSFDDFSSSRVLNLSGFPLSLRPDDFGLREQEVILSLVITKRITYPKGIATKAINIIIMGKTVSNKRELGASLDAQNGRSERSIVSCFNVVMVTFNFPIDGIQVKFATSDLFQHRNKSGSLQISTVNTLR